MEMYSLDIPNVPIKGGYLSSEQIDLLSIIQCKSIEELDLFVEKCDQINRIPDIKGKYKGLDLESAKRVVFHYYQESMVNHQASRVESYQRRLEYLGVSEEQLKEVISNKNHEILKANHHFKADERDQLKSIDLYSEMELLNSKLDNFNSFLIGSGKFYEVFNKYETGDNRFDFYFADRDLDFAYKKGKQVRYHSLLVKECDKYFEGKSKGEILDLIEEYVTKSIDHIIEYNNTHKREDGKPVINAIDMFNEIISFDKNSDGEYTNIWLDKYEITMEELLPCFKYAYEKKKELDISYVYNEPFMEDKDRRNKVIETLKGINEIYPGFIDTLGTQTHITIGEPKEKLESCFKDLKQFQDETGINIQITEFDMSLSKNDMSKLFGSEPQYNLSDVYDYKTVKIKELIDIIKASNIRLSGITYWSLTDGIDCNLERLRDELRDGKIRDVDFIPTAAGGLIPTHKFLLQDMTQEQHKTL